MNLRPPGYEHTRTHPRHACASHPSEASPGDAALTTPERPDVPPGLTTSRSEIWSETRSHASPAWSLLVHLDMEDTGPGQARTGPRAAPPAERNWWPATPPRCLWATAWPQRAIAIQKLHLAQAPFRAVEELHRVLCPGGVGKRCASASMTSMWRTCAAILGCEIHNRSCASSTAFDVGSSQRWIVRRHEAA